MIPIKIEIGPFKYNGQEKVKKQKQKMEFSKKILLISWLSGSVVILFACYLTYMMVMHDKQGDVQLVAIILTGGFAEITAGTSFYYWKSKNENMKKIGNNTGGYEE